MKVTIEANEEKQQEITFPCLMENHERTIKVWMNESRQGLVLESNTKELKQGEYCNFSLLAFQPLPKGTKVILEN